MNTGIVVRVLSNANVTGWVIVQLFLFALNAVLSHAQILDSLHISMSTIQIIAINATTMYSMVRLVPREDQKVIEIVR